MHARPALEPHRYQRSVDASRDTLGKPRMKLLEVVEHVRVLTDEAPYAVIGGLAQLLWARKTHTDDLDVALSSATLDLARSRIEARAERWSLPEVGSHEHDGVFEVLHALFDGAVVDLIRFQNDGLNAEVIDSAVGVPELGGIRFVRPELLLVTHLLRPGPTAALAAVEFVIARRAAGGFDEAVARRWAEVVGKAERLDVVVAQARALSLV